MKAERRGCKVLAIRQGRRSRLSAGAGEYFCYPCVNSGVTLRIATLLKNVNRLVFWGR